MKKFFLSIMAVAALMVTACSSKTTEKEATDEGEAIKARIENCTDPDSLKIYAQQAKEYAAKLEKEGNDTAARAYLEAVAPVVIEKDPTAASFFDKLEAKADSAVTETVEKADTLKDKAADAIGSTADKVKDKTKEVAGNVADKTKEVAGNVADKTKDVAGKVADKSKDVYNNTSDAVKDGADKVKNAFK